MIKIETLNEQGLSSALASAATNGAHIVSIDMFAKGAQVREKSIAEMTHPILSMAGDLAAKVTKTNSIIKTNTTADQLGMKVDISTLAQISKERISQKLYMPNIEEMLPIKVGENPFYDQTVFFKDFKFDNNPESGYISVNNKGQFNEVERGFQKFTVDRFFWAKQASWNVLQATQAGLINQNIVAEKIDWLMEDYAQSVTMAAMYGYTWAAGTGLFTGDDIPSSQGLPVTVNTSEITKPLSTMTYTELNAFVQSVIAVYQANNAIYEMPDTFVMPQSDYTGTGAFISPQYPIANSTFLEVLTKFFKDVTRNDSFKIVPTPYAQASFSANSIFGATAPLAYDRYILYKKEAKSLEFDIPVPLTMLSTGTVNSFSYAQLAFAQTGQVQNKRTQNMIYFDNPNT